MRCRGAILAVFAALMLLPATASAATLVPLAAARLVRERTGIRDLASRRPAGLRRRTRGRRPDRRKRRPPPDAVPDRPQRRHRSRARAALDRLPARLRHQRALLRLHRRGRAGRTRTPANAGPDSDRRVPPLRRPERRRTRLGATGVRDRTQRRQPQRRPDHVRARKASSTSRSGTTPTARTPRIVSNFFGKILRIDPGDPPGEATYSVPESNPAFPEDLKSAIYSIGLRNPYRASFGPSGELIVGDVGKGTWEEIDVGQPTGHDGGDYPGGRQPRLADLRGVLRLTTASAGPDRTRLRVSASAQRPLR